MKSPVNVAPLSSFGITTALKLCLMESRMSPSSSRFFSVLSSFLMFVSSISSGMSLPSAVIALWRMTLIGATVHGVARVGHDLVTKPQPL